MVRPVVLGGIQAFRSDIRRRSKANSTRQARLTEKAVKPAAPSSGSASPDEKAPKGSPKPKGPKTAPANAAGGPEAAKPKPAPKQNPAQAKAKPPVPVQPAAKPPVPVKKPAPPPAPAKQPAPPPAQPQPGPQVIEVPKMAGAAKPRKRHWAILLSFFLCVLLPSFLAVYYMYAVAVDQYESKVGFSVRAEESQSALDVLSGLNVFTTASASDTDILYEFIQSKEMVTRVDAQMDLRDVFTKPEFDPVFSLTENASIEELVDYWPRMVRVYYDSGAGLIEVRAFAFTREEALRLAELVFAESNRMINALSDDARADATRYAEEERDKAMERVIAARQALTEFRIRTQIVDPTADVEGQMGLLNNLQSQLAEVLIEQDLLLQTARENDPRLGQLQRRIDVIEARIAAERRKLGVGGALPDTDGAGETSYAELFGEYERLQVDREFAERAYLTALGAYDAAVAEAQRTSRYLAAYVRPTLSETSTAPDRLLLTLLVSGFLLITWFVGLLIYYSFRDRR